MQYSLWKVCASPTQLTMLSPISNRVPNTLPKTVMQALPHLSPVDRENPKQPMAHTGIHFDGALLDSTIRLVTLASIVRFIAVIAKLVF